MTIFTQRALWLVAGPAASILLGFVAFFVFVFGLGHGIDIDMLGTPTETFFADLGIPALCIFPVIGTLFSLWQFWRLSKQR